MKPWFEKEADIIKFPEPERKVIKMPSVSEYPDFISGVLDLQARRDKGQISQNSYDKLYQDLIHRFMKKESFDTPWFLKEDAKADLKKYVVDLLFKAGIKQTQSSRGGMHIRFPLPGEINDFQKFFQNAGINVEPSTVTISGTFDTYTLTSAKPIGKIPAGTQLPWVNNYVGKGSKVEKTFGDKELTPDSMNLANARVNQQKLLSTLNKAIKQIDTPATIHSFGTSFKDSNSTHLNNDQIVIKTKKNKTMINTLDFTLKGRHNLLNAMAASTVANLLEVSKETIRDSLLNFKGAPHRLEYVLKIQKINYINDSKATNVNAVYFALESMISPTVWIVGGVDKGNDYSLLYPLVREKVKAIVCLGVDNQKIIDSFNSFVDLILETQSMKEAVMIAHKIADKNENVLLSPACASFDLFKNFEDRGMQFKKAVREL